MTNAIDAKNMSNDPPQPLPTSARFIIKVKDVYLINGALVDFGMASVGESQQKTFLKAVTAPRPQ